MYSKKKHQQPLRKWYLRPRQNTVMRKNINSCYLFFRSTTVLSGQKLVIVLTGTSLPVSLYYTKNGRWGSNCTQPNSPPLHRVCLYRFGARCIPPKLSRPHDVLHGPFPPISRQYDSPQYSHIWLADGSGGKSSGRCIQCFRGYVVQWDLVHILCFHNHFLRPGHHVASCGFCSWQVPGDLSTDGRPVWLEPYASGDCRLMGLRPHVERVSADGLVCLWCRSRKHCLLHQMAIDEFFRCSLRHLPLCLFLLWTSRRNPVLLHPCVPKHAIHDTKRAKDLGCKRRCYLGNHPGIVEDG